MTQSLRIVTLNTWKGEGDYPRRLALIEAGLAELNADIICLQECLKVRERGFDTGAFLGDQLGLHVVQAEAREKARSIGSESVLSTSGLAILSRKPSQSTLVLPLETDDADGGRCLLMAGFDYDSEQVWVGNLHASHLRDQRGADLRRCQIHQTLTALAALPSGPVILAGDFNAPLDAPECMSLLAAAELDWGPDSISSLPPTINEGLRSHSPSQARAIDHILLLRAGMAWRVARRQRALDTAAPDDGQYPSDHAAIVVDLVKTEGTLR
jgi:endonuclease/exonuclease/phosphatase family metal-dependent hydrolase